MTSRPFLSRAFGATDLEVRGDGRTLVGIAVPFDTPTWIGDLGAEEVFRRGSFARTIRERADRVKILANHDRRSWPLGRATLLREDPTGLYLEARVSATAAGDEALELIRDGALDAFSVGFQSIDERWSRNGDLVERLEVALREVSVVAFPAYDDARIVAVRSATASEHASWRARLRLPSDHRPAVPGYWRDRLQLPAPTVSQEYR
jgi:HK97 family phage prohead protease